MLVSVFYTAYCGNRDTNNFFNTYYFGNYLGFTCVFGFGSTLKIKNTNLKISYFRGIKTSYISIDEIEKITISPNREVSLVFKQNQKTLRIFLNARNKKKFCAYIERYASNIVFEKQKAWSEMPKLK